MQKQQGACAFSNSCIVPGPRERMPGTNREFCHVHMMAMTLPAAPSGGTEFARSEFRPPSAMGSRSRRRSAWLAMAVGAASL